MVECSRLLHTTTKSDLKTYSKKLSTFQTQPKPYSKHKGFVVVSIEFFVYCYENNIILVCMCNDHHINGRFIRNVICHMLYVILKNFAWADQRAKV